jgi:uncharacterized protein (DUF1800 family)
MALSKQQMNVHLLQRAAFGPALSQLPHLNQTSYKSLFNTLLKQSVKTPVSYAVIDADLVAMASDTVTARSKNMDVSTRRMIRVKNRESIKQLNLFWFNNMITEEDQLREKMTLFWHGHFACRSLNAIHQQALLNEVRTNALGSFRELLFAVSRSGAMLNFLNNNQNRKNHPNENFAREVMELFTLGRGNYTEKDIKEAARAFTGWGADITGAFVFRRQQHDDGDKTVLGKTGNFTGDEVLNILLEQKQTALFITQKIYRFFVNEEPDDTIIRALAEKFYNSDYDITGLIKNIFTADWFYDQQNAGVKIKSPVELLVGIQRVLPMQIQNQNALIQLQRILGQVLLYPPNVAGWPGGKSWIDSSTLVMRMRIPRLVSDADMLNIKPKDDDDQMMGKKDDDDATVAVMARQKMVAVKLLNAIVDWKKYIAYFNNVPKDDLLATIGTILFSSGGNMPAQLIKQYADISNRNDFIRTATIRLMSLPEYQLC